MVVRFTEAYFVHSKLILELFLAIVSCPSSQWSSLHITYHMSVAFSPAVSKLPVNMAIFSPASFLSLLLACCNVRAFASFSAHACASLARSSAQLKGGTPCIERNLLCASRDCFGNSSLGEDVALQSKRMVKYVGWEKIKCKLGLKGPTLNSIKTCFLLVSNGVRTTCGNFFCWINYRTGIKQKNHRIYLKTAITLQNKY